MSSVLEKIKKALEEMGFQPAYFRDEDEVYEDQLDCIIDGMNFGVGLDDEEEGAVWFSVIFEPEKDLTEAEFVDVQKQLGDTAVAFEDALLAEDGTVHVLTCKNEEECTGDLLQLLVKDLKDPDGALQRLKSLSYVWES